MNKIFLRHSLASSKCGSSCKCPGQGEIMEAGEAGLGRGGEACTSRCYSQAALSRCDQSQQSGTLVSHGPRSAALMPSHAVEHAAEH